MIDLSKYKCPHCGYKRDNYAIGNKAICGTCGIAVEGSDHDDERYTGAAIFIRLSEAVHGKPHEGETVDVRIAVAVDETGQWNSCGFAGATDEEMMGLVVEPLEPGELRRFITATLPLPAVQEIKGRVEG